MESPLKKKKSNLQKKLSLSLEVVFDLFKKRVQAQNWEMETHLQNKWWRSERCTDVTAVYADSLMPRRHEAGLLATMLAVLKGQAQLAELNILPADRFSTFSTCQSGHFPLQLFDGNLICISSFLFSKRLLTSHWYGNKATDHWGARTRFQSCSRIL